MRFTRVLRGTITSFSFLFPDEQLWTRSKRKEKDKGGKCFPSQSSPAMKKSKRKTERQKRENESSRSNHTPKTEERQNDVAAYHHHPRKWNKSKKKIIVHLSRDAKNGGYVVTHNGFSFKERKQKMSSRRPAR